MSETVERTLEETPTWAVAVVCFVLLAISIAIEHLIHIVGKWLNNRHKRALFEALEKVKAELMLMGFISLMLTVGQGPISNICVSQKVADTWHPCNKQQEVAKYGATGKATGGRRLLSFLFSDTTGSTPRRSLASKSDKCTARAHLAPGSETKFDFNKYIRRSLEQDFVVVVGITPVLWLIAMLFLLTNTHGWMSYLWLPFIPLIIILLVGTKLQVIITKLGLRIQERGDVVKGAPVVQPGDELFWFGKPRFILFLIHLVLFQNAFQLAFFIWTVYEFTIKSCYHKQLEDIIIRISMGILIQILCSYVTLPLYALVTQMGTTMKPTIFNDRVAAALKNWHHTAKKNTKHLHGRHSESNTPYSSRPQTPTHAMSPVHLLHSFPKGSLDTPSPRRSSFDHDRWDPESQRSPRHYHANDSHHGEGSGSVRSEQEMVIQESTTIINTQLPPGPGPIRTQHEIHNTSSGFSFATRGQ
ncbi:hypothetical protein LWI28_014165 [Acer negundo]|uniref:MLO-like protein n=1 Tax=Acer negundo TaxID=4023 RepID=A0AAD5I9E8_ACENE|nr:hypothetical protein LWI28_014165 [Acer negundo]